MLHEIAMYYKLNKNMFKKYFTTISNFKLNSILYYDALTHHGSSEERKECKYNHGLQIIIIDHGTTYTMVFQY